jgi:hypothetical protein
MQDHQIDLQTSNPITIAHEPVKMLAMSDHNPTQSWASSPTDPICIKKTSPGLPLLDMLPPEVRQQVFRHVAQTEGIGSLLVALRSTHKDSTIYEEAVQAYYYMKLCTITKSNEALNKDISAHHKQLVRHLVIKFE